MSDLHSLQCALTALLLLCVCVDLRQLRACAGAQHHLQVQGGALRRLSCLFSVRLQPRRRRSGAGADEMPTLPRQELRADKDVAWESLQQRGGMVRLVLKLLSTISSIVCPGNPDALWQAVSEALQRLHGHQGNAAAAAAAVSKLLESVRTCSSLLPRDSL